VFTVIDGQRTLVGVNRGFVSLEVQFTRFEPTYIGSDIDNASQPRVAPWLSRITECIRAPRALSVPTVPLFSWWSDDRGDNFATSDPRWRMDPRLIVRERSGEHIANGPRTPDGIHTLYRLEGYLFDPKRPQPSGTVPLFSWWSDTRGDNFATSDPRWRMSVADISWRGEHIANGPRTPDGTYTLYRLEGYLLDRRVECAPGAGQDQAAVLTVCRVWWSSNWAGLR
jgi:hypothetical protein